MGRLLVPPMATASTPGIVATRRTASRRNAARLSGGRYGSAAGLLGTGIQIWAVTIPWGLNPGCTSSKRQKLRSSKPAPTSRISDNAISEITSQRDRRAWVRLEPEPLLPSRRCETWLMFEACSAGTRPNRIPVAMERPKAKSNTPPPKFTSLKRGRLSGARRSSEAFIQTTVSSATDPAMNESSKLSVSI